MGANFGLFQHTQGRNELDRGPTAACYRLIGGPGMADQGAPLDQDQDVDLAPLVAEARIISNTGADGGSAAEVARGGPTRAAAPKRGRDVRRLDSIAFLASV